MRLPRLIGVVMLVGLIFVVTSAPASAEIRTATYTINNVTVPFYNVTATGVLTMTYDDVTGIGTWNYQGTIGGQTVNASGSGICEWAAASGVRGLASFAQTDVVLTMTSIDSWNMPGFAPWVPREAAVSSLGELAYVNYDGRHLDVFGVPIAFSPPLSFPVEGNFVVSNPASGQQPVTTLPSTGVGPGGSDSPVWVDRWGSMLVPIIGGLVALIVAVSFGGRSRVVVPVHG